MLAWTDYGSVTMSTQFLLDRYTQLGIANFSGNCNILGAELKKQKPVILKCSTTKIVPVELSNDY